MCSALLSQKNRRIRIMGVSLWDWLIYFVTLAASGWLFLYGAVESGYEWHWRKSIGYLGSFTDGFTPGPLLLGLGVTMEISLSALVLALAAGVLSALMQMFGGPLCRLVVRTYIECIRNTPLLVQLYIAYVLAHQFNLSAITASIVALGLFEGAYISEILRAGLLSVSQGQREAAFSLGFGPLQTEVLVVWPQALRSASPPLVSQGITLVKDSSLASSIGVAELTKHAMIIISDTYMVFEIWFLTAGLYLLVTLSLARLAQIWLKRRAWI